MRRKIMSALSFVVGAIMGICCVSVTAEKVTANTKETVSKFDLNGDGTSNVFDLVRMKQFLVGAIPDERVEVSEQDIEKAVRTREIERLLDIPRGEPVIFPANVPTYIQDNKIDSMLSLSHREIVSLIGNRGMYQHVFVQDAKGTLMIRVNFEEELTDEDFNALSMGNPDNIPTPDGKSINRSSIVVFFSATDYLNGEWGRYNDEGEFVKEDNLRISKVYVVE